MIATSMAQLEQQMIREMRKAMQVVNIKAEKDLFEETAKFYTGGTPVKYQRTGALGSTPRVSAITGSGKFLTFKTFLDTSGGYSTGKNPSMLAVLTLANYGSYPGLRPTVGKGGFWESAEQKIQRDLNSTFASFFGR